MRVNISEATASAVITWLAIAVMLRLSSWPYKPRSFWGWIIFVVFGAVFYLAGKLIFGRLFLAKSQGQLLWGAISLRQYFTTNHAWRDIFVVLASVLFATVGVWLVSALLGPFL